VVLVVVVWVLVVLLAVNVFVAVHVLVVVFLVVLFLVVVFLVTLLPLPLASTASFVRLIGLNKKAHSSDVRVVIAAFISVA
jgi:hypothetical protein